MGTSDLQQRVCDALAAIGVTNFVIALPQPDEPDTFYVWRMSGGASFDLGVVKAAVLGGVPREAHETAGFGDEYIVIKG